MHFYEIRVECIQVLLQTGDHRSLLFVLEAMPMRFRFSIRAMILLTTIASIPSFLVRSIVVAQIRNDQALVAIKNHGGYVQSIDGNGITRNVYFVPEIKPGPPPSTRLFMNQLEMSCDSSAKARPSLDYKVIDALHDIARLRTLCIVGYSLPKNAVTDIASLTSLEYLSLADTDITDEDALLLVSLTRLKKLDLSATSISAQTLHELRHNLPMCKVD